MVHRWIAACIALVVLLPVGAAGADVPQGPLTLERALVFARAHRAERVALAASLAAARADSVAVSRPIAESEWGGSLALAGEQIGGTRDRTAEIEWSRRFEPRSLRTARRDAAGAEVASEAAAGVAASGALAFEVRGAFARARFADERVALADELARHDAAWANRTASRVREGTLTPLTSRLAVLDRAGSETRLDGERTRQVAARLELAQALGADALPDSLVPEADAPDLLADPTLASVAEQRTDVRAARARTEAARAAVTLARRGNAISPRLGLGLSFEHRELDSPGAGLANSTITDVSRGVHVRVSVPLGDARRRDAEVARAEAHVARAAAEAQAVARSARSEIATAAAEHRAAQANVARWLALEPQARDDLARVREAYADGRLPASDYVALRDRLVAARLAALDARERMILARLALERALDTPDLETSR